MILIISIIALGILSLKIYNKNASIITVTSTAVSFCVCYALFNFHSLGYNWLFKYLIFDLSTSFILLTFICFLIFLINGIRLIFIEGVSKINFLSIIFSIYLLIGLIILGFTKLNLNLIFSENIILKIIFSSYIFSLVYFFTYFYIAMLSPKGLNSNEDFDYVIVLGAAILGDEMTRIVAKRVEKAVDVLSVSNAKLITSGGQGPGENLSEGLAMKNYAVFSGIDESRILIEDKSTTTLENLKFSKEMIDEDFKGKGTPKIAIVTSSFHVFRSIFFALNLNIDAKGYGAISKKFYLGNALIREALAFWVVTFKAAVLSYILFVLFIYLYI